MDVKPLGSPDLFGLTFVPTTAPGGTFVIVASHLDQSTASARGSLAQTVAHVLFHVVQFAYAPGALPRWVAEGTAAAMELLVIPKVQDEVNAPAFDQWLAEPWRSLFDERFSCEHSDGGATWWATFARRGRTCARSSSRRSVGSTPRIVRWAPASRRSICCSAGTATDRLARFLSLRH